MSKTICLDPGHGGYDSGAVGNGLREKDINLTVALQLRDILQAAGIHVVMTRESDTSPGGFTDVNQDLAERCHISDQAGADLFLSIHVNAGGGTGAEIYVYGDGGNIHGLAGEIVNQVATIMGFHGEPIKDGSGLYVIRNTQAPAMLLELGFIDSSDAQKIKEHIHDFAKLIAPPLIQWLGGTMPKPEEVPPVDDITGHPLETAILFAKEKHLMGGYPDGSFRPDQPITRAEVAAVLKNLFAALNKDGVPAK